METVYFRNRPVVVYDTIPINANLNVADTSNVVAAATGLHRDQQTVYLDNLFGAIAQACVCDYLMQNGEGEISSLNNQLIYNDKIITVRSSVIRNGIEFALFNTNNVGDHYVNLLGDYTGNSNSSEYYFQVLFSGDRDNLLQDIRSNCVETYLIGGLPSTHITQQKRIKSTLYRLMPLLSTLTPAQFVTEISRC